MPRLGEKLSAWLALSRLPFHSVGVLPFILGMVLAWRLRGVFRHYGKSRTLTIRDGLSPISDPLL
jgi:1,4-dihydroxy-2-naphthoate octaprenyltransferase